MRTNKGNPYSIAYRILVPSSTFTFVAPVDASNLLNDSLRSLNAYHRPCYATFAQTTIAQDCPHAELCTVAKDSARVAPSVITKSCAITFRVRNLVSLTMISHHLTYPFRHRPARYPPSHLWRCEAYLGSDTRRPTGGSKIVMKR